MYVFCDTNCYAIEATESGLVLSTKDFEQGGNDMAVLFASFDVLSSESRVIGGFAANTCGVLKGKDVTQFFASLCLVGDVQEVQQENTGGENEQSTAESAEQPAGG